MSVWSEDGSRNYDDNALENRKTLCANYRLLEHAKHRDLSSLSAAGDG